MKGKKIVSVVLTGLFTATMFTGVAFAEKKAPKVEELQKSIKVETKLHTSKTKQTTEIKVTTFTKTVGQVRKGDTIKVTKAKKATKKYSYDVKKIKKDLWIFKEAKQQMQRPVTYQQALALTVRAMGYGSVNQSAYQVDNFSPKFKYADWAKTAVQVAVYQGLVTMEDLNKHNPNKPITRADLAVLLVKAKGVQVNDIAVLTVKDAAYIPADKAPYVAAALKEGWFTAYKNNSFMPNKPVTRMIFASAFIKAGFDASAFMPKTYEVKATIANIDAAKCALTAKVEGAEIPYAVSDKVQVSVNGKQKSLADLQAGMTAKIKIENNVVVAIKAATVKVDVVEEDNDKEETSVQTKTVSKKRHI